MTFEHYKGNRYKFIGLALDEATLAVMVLYSPVTDLTVVWSRRADEFFGLVQGASGGLVHRFRPIPPGE